MTRSVLLALGLTGLLAGCGLPPGEGSRGHRYLDERVGDLLDPWDAAVTVGPGVGLLAAAVLPTVGYATGTVRAHGLDGRGAHPPTAYEHWAVGLPASPFFLGAREHMVPAMEPLVAFGVEDRVRAVDGEPLDLWCGPVRVGPDDEPRWADSFRIGLSLHLGWVGARLFVRPLQIVDLVLGLFLVELDPDPPAVRWPR